MLKVALHTLGCKVNQYETEQLAAEFARRGFELVSFTEAADVYVINSCTVTHTADAKSRQVARAAARRNPGAKVVLTGCYAETDPGGFSGADLVLGNREKAQIVDRVAELVGEPDAPGADAPRGRTRALLKVQDGCDQFCAYCAVPLVRPVMWSKPLQEAVEEAWELAAGGFTEVVLTGIRLGRYEPDLSRLLAELSEVEGIRRIRMSSIELTDMPPDLLAVMAENPKICRHLHIPLQSGDDAVLARMKRPYRVAEFAAFVREARAALPGLAVTTDIIVGFPGETAEEFEKTLRFAEEISFSRAHVFRYSPRRGTEAAEMRDDVSPREKEERSARLSAVTARCAEEFARSLVGKSVEVLSEGDSGLTDTYVRVMFGEERPAGSIVSVKIERAESGTAFGRVKEEVWTASSAK
ncbi:MAG: tRNA (N(6)-L-threonylcarbamoyladenosine(37)-C(2))-methylthiotransferase MtaB [Armatimonadota bacterium]